MQYGAKFLDAEPTDAFRSVLARYFATPQGGKKMELLSESDLEGFYLIHPYARGFRTTTFPRALSNPFLDGFYNHTAILRVAKRELSKLTAPEEAELLRYAKIKFESWRRIMESLNVFFKPGVVWARKEHIVMEGVMAQVQSLQALLGSPHHMVMWPTDLYKNYRSQMEELVSNMHKGFAEKRRLYPFVER